MGGGLEAGRVGYVIVYVRSMEEQLRFWRDTLGFKTRYESPEWSEVELSNVVLALHRSSGAEPRDTGIVFLVDDARSAVEDLKRRGVRVTEPRDIGVGLEAIFYDPEGNAFHIFQPSG